MRNGTFFIGENKHLADAVAFCAARTFFTTKIKMFFGQIISYNLAMGSEWKRRAPCGTRHSLLTQQPTTTISRRRWKVCPRRPPATTIPGSEFLFSQDPLSKFFASDEHHGQSSQIARLPRLCEFWKIEPGKTSCRLLLNRI
jgi:hypothetical protein